MSTLSLHPSPRTSKLVWEHLKNSAHLARMAATSPDVAAAFAAAENEFGEREEAAALAATQPQEAK